MKKILASLMFILSAGLNAAELNNTLPASVNLDKPIDSPLTLMKLIFDNPNKAYVATLVGPMDQKIREATKHEGETVLAGVQKARYNDKCSRIALSFITKATPTKDGKKVDWFTRIDFDYCTDLSKPPTAINLEDLTRLMTPPR